MYSNVGGKIKLVAKLYGWITLIGGLLTFFILLGDYDFGEVFYVPILALTGFATSWPLYGFGQLVDDVQAIKENSKQQPEVTCIDELPEI